VNKETFAIIGYGSIGRRHAANLAGLRPRARIVKVDPARVPGVDFQDLAQCLAVYPSLAGALICSPHGEHLDALDTLTAVGIPVYLEKPVCSTAQYGNYKTYQRVSQISRRGVVVGMGFQYRYHAIAESLQELRDEIKQLDFVARDDLVTRYGPTVAETMGSHSIDLALWLLGPAYAVKLTSNGLTLTGHILHATGKVSNYDINMAAGPRGSTIAALRTNGTARVVPIDADEWMYQRCLADWLRLIDGAPSIRHRLALLHDGLAVQDVLGRVSALRHMKYSREAQ